jgi:hypothetical protein
MVAFYVGNFTLFGKFLRSSSLKWPPESDSTEARRVLKMSKGLPSVWHRKLNTGMIRLHLSERHQ